MNKLFTTFATLALAGSVSASNESYIYHGFEENNPDLYAGRSTMDEITSMQPSSAYSRRTSLRDTYNYGISGYPLRANNSYILWRQPSIFENGPPASKEGLLQWHKEGGKL